MNRALHEQLRATFQKSLPGVAEGISSTLATKAIEVFKEYEAEIRTEEAGLTASRIQMEMAPLAVHRLEAGFPSMTKEIIEKTFVLIHSYTDKWQKQVKQKKNAL